MMAQSSSFSSSSRVLRSNYMEALSSSQSEEILSPESSSPDQDGFTLEMSDLMLPASALECELFGVPQDSNATVVSNASSEPQELAPPPAVITTTARSRKCKQSSSHLAVISERRHSLPSTLMLSSSPLGEAVTQPVPEFLCHLFSMLRDPSYADMISWQVPTSDEPDHMGGGIRDIGKIVVSRPEALQDGVLGKYYRHSKYASFQRQLNYFGFKKRLHGGKKGKLSPCSYIHEFLTEDVGSLFTLKRRPPAKKRASMEAELASQDCAASVSSMEDSSSSSSKSSKKRRLEKKSSKKSSSSKSSSKSSKKDKKRQNQTGKQQVVVTSVPLQVQAEEYSAPSPVRPIIAVTNTQYQPQPAISASAIGGKQLVMPSRPGFVRTITNEQVSSSSHTVVSQQSPKPVAAAAPLAAQPTLLEMLSTSLPPSDVLFNDNLDADSLDDEGVPTWVTDDGQYHYHNVDSSLVDLAMLY